jgi:glycine cleavage system H protein
MYPNNLRYTKEHEWIKVEGNFGIVGITDFAQSELGDIVFVELPAVGKKVGKGDSFGTVESVKAVSEIYSPVTGEVADTNTKLNDSPEQINKDPHGAAWLVKIRLANAAELEGLMDAAAYLAFISDKQKGH